MGEHTKGPLNAENGRVYSSDATGSIVAQCCDFKWAPRLQAEEEANADRIAATWNFAAGFPTASLTGSSLAEVCAVLKAAEAVMGRNIYPQPDKPSQEWAALCDLRTLLARLKPTDTGE